MILVTGGAGYVGSLLVPELLALGETVRVVDPMWFGDPFASLGTGPFTGHERLETVRGDLRQFDPAWLDGVKAVVHLAGLSNDPTADFAPALNNESNVFASRRLAEAVAERATREDRDIRFLFASTCSVYYSAAGSGSNVEEMTEERPIAPTSNYSKTKRLAEIDILRIADAHHRFCPVILRKGTIFGAAPRMRFDLVVNTFTLHAWTKHLVTVHGSGEAWRPLLHIRDAVDAYVHLLAAPNGRVRGEIFNLIHKNYRILELAHWVSEVIEQRYEVEVRVKRDRGSGDGARSYYVSGDKLTAALGFQAERGAAEAVATIWDGLERGDYGPEPGADPRFFNIRWLKETVLQPQAVPA